MAVQEVFDLDIVQAISDPYREAADIGVEIDLEYMPADRFFEDGPDGPLFGRRFDLGLIVARIEARQDLTLLDALPLVARRRAVRGLFCGRVFARRLPCLGLFRRLFFGRGFGLLKPALFK